MGCCCPHSHETPAVKLHSHKNVPGGQLEVQFTSISQNTVVVLLTVPEHCAESFAQREAVVSLLVLNTQLFKENVLPLACISMHMPPALNQDAYLVTPRK